MSDEQQNMDLFQGLIVSLAAGVMQHLGKTLNPVTNKIEQNLPAAQATIDMLDMLAVKTKGNLTEAEEKLLKGMLAELKLNYVDTLNDSRKKKEESAPSDEAAGQPADTAAADDSAPAPEPPAAETASESQPDTAD